MCCTTAGRTPPEADPRHTRSANLLVETVHPVASVSSYVSRTVGIRDTSKWRGNRHDWTESRTTWSGPVPQRRPMPGVGQDAAPSRRSSGGQRGSVGRGLARLCFGGSCGRPTREARPPRGAPTSLAAAARDGELPAREVAARHRVAAILARGSDHSAWSLRSLPPEWTGSKAPTSSAARTGARPQRGPARKRARPAWPQQRSDLRECWWARQGLNL
jgi:hypothetical protein